MSESVGVPGLLTGRMLPGFQPSGGFQQLPEVGSVINGPPFWNVHFFFSCGGMALVVDHSSHE